ncbi:MAG: hypothetical protein Q8Q40_09600, partial [Methylococcaceae bacterium]|nr:hypothetical protein [Methylococcaceae bacterium]MDP3904219.1 hypothetical protein [Methylococcaceae bacterium]
IAENGDFRLKQVLMRGQNTKNSRDSVADLSLSVYFLFIRAVFRGALQIAVTCCPQYMHTAQLIWRNITIQKMHQVNSVHILNIVKTYRGYF